MKIKSYQDKTFSAFCGRILNIFGMKYIARRWVKKLGFVK
jgi:hypothetical protein